MLLVLVIQCISWIYPAGCFLVIDGIEIFDLFIYFFCHVLNHILILLVDFVAVFGFYVVISLIDLIRMENIFKRNIHCILF